MCLSKVRMLIMMTLLLLLLLLLSLLLLLLLSSSSPVCLLPGLGGADVQKKKCSFLGAIYMCFLLKKWF